MKISIITAVKNRATVVGRALESLKVQDYPNWEHLIVDGSSVDGTREIILDYHRSMGDKVLLIDELDQGLYGALNLGLAHATGDVVGFLHSDDYFASKTVLSEIIQCFSDKSVDAIYGNLNYVSNNTSGKVCRQWSSRNFNLHLLKFGWMPPHPTLYMRKEVYERIGGFNSDYKISADYDLVLRCFKSPHFKSKYLPKTLVVMGVGGVSNGSYSSFITKAKEDFEILKNHQIWGGALIFKRLLKIVQFF